VGIGHCEPLLVCESEKPKLQISAPCGPHCSLSSMCLLQCVSRALEFVLARRFVRVRPTRRPNYEWSAPMGNAPPRRDLVSRGNSSSLLLQMAKQLRICSARPEGQPRPSRAPQVVRARRSLTWPDAFIGLAACKWRSLAARPLALVELGPGGERVAAALPRPPLLSRPRA